MKIKLNKKLVVFTGNNSVPIYNPNILTNIGPIIVYNPLSVMAIIKNQINNKVSLFDTKGNVVPNIAVNIIIDIYNYLKFTLSRTEPHTIFDKDPNIIESVNI